ncbi:MAG: hypothetical protein ACI3XT_06180 [Butyricicoccaceae bacterium]
MPNRKRLQNRHIQLKKTPICRRRLFVKYKQQTGQIRTAVCAGLFPYAAKARGGRSHSYISSSKRSVQNMDAVLDFLCAALPLVAMGLFLAVVFARRAGKKQRKAQTADHAAEGMCIGMCIGTAIGTSILDNVGLGISLGMLLGLAVGTSIEKRGADDEEK